MKTRKKSEIKFAVCINDSEPDLELRKIYKVLPDEAAANTSESSMNLEKPTCTC